MIKSGQLLWMRKGNREPCIMPTIRRHINHPLLYFHSDCGSACGINDQELHVTGNMDARSFVTRSTVAFASWHHYNRVCAVVRHHQSIPGSSNIPSCSKPGILIRILARLNQETSRNPKKSYRIKRMLVCRVPCK